MTLDLTTISVLIGVIGGILGILNQLSTMRRQQDEALRNQATRDKEMDDRMKRIEERLTEHNNYAKLFSDAKEGISQVKESIVAMQTDIKWIKEETKK